MEQHQLTIARECRGMTMSALAAEVDGLSQSNLSNYERGIGTLSDAVKRRIMERLGFPMSFLGLRTDNRIESRHYRKKASIRERDRKIVDRKIALFASLFDWMADYAELPPLSFPYVDFGGGTTPESAAEQVRRRVRLGGEPLSDVCRFLESNGVFVFFWDCEYEWFDGVSLLTDGGYHLIVVNGNKPNDRIRFSLAHELGHVMLHECMDFFFEEGRDKESEANRFASELLMPERWIRDSLHGLTLKRLRALKSYWLVSMGALLQRAVQLGGIDGGKYTYMRVEFSRNGWNRREPDEVDIDSPSVIGKLWGLLSGELGFSIADAAEKSCLPLDIVGEMLGRGRVVSLFK